MDNRKRLAIILALIFLLSFLIYAGFEAEKLIYGPQIILNSPRDEDTLQGNGALKVSGITKNISFISLNGRPIFTDANGNFSETLVLLPGYNIITLSAKGRYGKEISKKLHLYLVKSSENTQTNLSAQDLNGQAFSTSTASTTSTSTVSSTSTKKL